MSMTSDRITRLPEERLVINADWLIKLRWVAVVGQLTTITVVHFGLGIDISRWPLLVGVGVTALSNLILDGWVRHARNAAGSYSRSVWYGVLGGVMLLDLLVLTSLLYFTGGPTNPFSIFYFVNLALSGILLPAKWAWLLDGIAVMCLSLICYDHQPVEILQQASRLKSIRATGEISLASLGLFVAFVTCSSVIVYFATRLTSELQRRERDLRRAESLRARSEKLEALGTLAAGAAHELATPLSTIAVVAKEVERELDGKNVARLLVQDIALIRSELDRCRAILDRMSVTSGRAIGEPITTVTVEELVDTVLSDLSRHAPVRSQIDPEAKRQEISVPLTGLAQSLRGVVQNALDASEGVPVDLAVDLDGGALRLTVRDSGPGMSVAVLARAGDPFFTTKEPGKGMGLGLFLARSLVERIGGSLNIHSVVGHGTTVEVRLPTSSTISSP